MTAIVVPPARYSVTEGSESRRRLAHRDRNAPEAIKGQRWHTGGGVLSLLAIAAVVLSVAGVLGWQLTGGKLVVMETPSMCPTVCVGSLVADRPLVGPVHVGELITFYPPNTRAETYTHEISHIFPNGMIQTRGVGNPQHDPWLITRSDIVGRTAFSIWGLGWVYKALPLLAVGVMAWVLARPSVARRSRRAWDLGWATILVILPIWMLRPLVRATVITSTVDKAHPHWASVSVVNTGILPVSFHIPGGTTAAPIASTGRAVLSGPASANRPLVVHQTVFLPWWGWAIAALLVLSPLIGYLWHAWRDSEPVPELATDPDDSIASDPPLKGLVVSGSGNPDRSSDLVSHCCVVGAPAGTPVSVGARPGVYPGRRGDRTTVPVPVLVCNELANLKVRDQVRERKSGSRSGSDCPASTRGR